MKQVFLIISLGVFTSLSTFAAQSGCDYWVRTNGHWGQSQTSWGKKCEDLSWDYPDGTSIPESDIICCDFDENGNYLGTGINCSAEFPAGSPRVATGSELPNSSGLRIAKERNAIYGTLHGNWYFAPYLKIAIDGTGDVSIFHHKLKEKLPLLNIEKKYSNKPVNVTYNTINKKQIQLVITPLDGKKTKTDTTGSEYFIFDIDQLKKDFYNKTKDEILTISPNPIKNGNNINIISKIPGNELTVYIYTNNGKLASTKKITGVTANELKCSELNKGLYHIIVEIDNTTINGGLLEIE